MQNIPVFSAAHQAKFERTYSDPLAGRPVNNERRPSQLEQGDTDAIELLWNIRRMSVRRIQSQIDDASIAHATSSVIASTDTADSDSDGQDEPEAATPTHRDDSSVTGSRHSNKFTDGNGARRQIEHTTRSISPLRAVATAPMAFRTYTWVSLWFLLTTPVILWDVSYCFMRPRSMVGGDLHWIWKPYEIYQEVDYIYGIPSLERKDGFTNAQSTLNVIETFMNLTYLYYAHVGRWAPANLIGFAAAVMTLSKTVLYWLQEYFCSGCAVGHNSLHVLIVYWIIPNGLWIIVPSLIVIRLGKDLIRSLTFAEAAAKQITERKHQ